MQTYLALSEICPCWAQARLIAWSNRATLVVHFAKLTLKQTQCVVEGAESSDSVSPHCFFFLSIFLLFFLHRLLISYCAFEAV